MKIKIDDRFIYILFENNDEKDKLISHYTFDDTSKAFSGGEFDAKKIKKVKLIYKKKKLYYLYSGFLYDLILFLKRNDFKFEISFDVTKFDFQKKDYSKDYIYNNYFKKFKYAEHQANALLKMIKINRGIIKMPTSSGKTALMFAYMKLANLPTLIVVKNVSLCNQLYSGLLKNGFKNVGISHGKAYKEGDFMVSTIGSVKKVKNLHRYKILLLDEVHRAKSNTYQEFLKSVSFPIKFGFSATPIPNTKFDWAKIRQFMGEIIYEASVDELIQNEVIAHPTIEFISVFCEPTLDWPSANEYAIIKNEERNKKIKDLVEKNNNLQTLILVFNLEHGKLLEEMIDNSFFLNGEFSQEEQKEIIDKFTNKEIKVLIATSIFYEGISIDAIDMLIIATGRKSKIETIQKLGRGLRTRVDKKKVLVYDFYDYGNKFTQRHSEQRIRIYKREGFEVHESN